MIKLKTLSTDYHGLFLWAQHNHQRPLKRDAKVLELGGKKDMTTKVKDVV